VEAGLKPASAPECIARPEEPHGDHSQSIAFRRVRVEAGPELGVRGQRLALGCAPAPPGVERPSPALPSRSVTSDEAAYEDDHIADEESQRDWMAQR